MINKNYLYIGAAALAFYIYFGRCPKRTPDSDEGYLSPADGIIVGMEDNNILIQLSIFDVHCQRAPCDCFVCESENINNITIIDDSSATSIIALRQGAVGRSFRIDIKVANGERVQKGQVISQIWLGSNVRFTIPENYKFTQHLGDIVYAGQTVIAV